MNKNKNLLRLLVLIPVICLSGGCDNNSSQSFDVSSGDSSSSIDIASSSQSISSTDLSSSFEGPASVTNPRKYSLSLDNPVEISLVGPFTVYTETGETPSLTKDKMGSTNADTPATYSNMYEAIRVAGNNSTSKNKLQVQDANFTQIFIRGKQSNNFVFNGKKYLGEAGSTSAKTYCFSHPESYAVNGTGSDYNYLGRHDMVQGQTVTEAVLETPAGAYNYMFSKGGSGGKDYGYRYCTADVRMSEVTYKAPTDGGSWNAYIFINMSDSILVDLGLIGICNGSRVDWKLVRNCQSKMHTAGTSGIEKDARFYVYQDTTKYPNCVVTSSKSYNQTTGEYSGFDDLHFEAFTQTDGWTLNITNLRTGVVSTIDDRHTDSQGNPLKENTNGIGSRALIAASYCPVTGNVWNWDCGAALKNVVWENIEMKKTIYNGDTISDNIEDYRNASTKYEFYPDTPVTYRDGYSQGGYCASHEFGVRDANGTYKSGNTYSKGNKYLTFSVDYNH